MAQALDGAVVEVDLAHAEAGRLRDGVAKDLDTGKVFITSQNHGFAVDEKTLPANVRATHRSLFDGTLQGIELTDKPAYSFQGHPEASPGPREMSYLFDRFVAMMEKKKSA